MSCWTWVSPHSAWIVGGGPVRLGAAAAVAVAIYIDDVGPDRLHRIVGEAQLGDRLAAHRVDEDVGSRDECAQHRLVRLVAQVEHQAALAAVHVDEDAAHARRGADGDVARVVAARRLDLDHVGAHIGHDLRRIGAEHHAREIDDADAGKRAFVLGHDYSRCAGLSYGLPKVHAYFRSVCR
jgi:hypothetical protein